LLQFAGGKRFEEPRGLSVVMACASSATAPSKAHEYLPTHVSAFFGVDPVLGSINLLSPFIEIRSFYMHGILFTIFQFEYCWQKPYFSNTPKLSHHDKLIQ
jgi:hypothetical protein